MSTITEPVRHLPLHAGADVVVCGGGPAGVAAALAAARQGASTLLIEGHGCLGGVWTSGMLSLILDAKGKGGIMAEIAGALAAAGGGGPVGNNGRYDPEIMKLVLERLCQEAGVRVRLHTRICAAIVEGREIRAVVGESRSGREAWAASMYIDCTGDGDLAAQAGSGFDLGHPDSGACQPLSLMALLTGIEVAAMAPFICSREHQIGKDNLLAELRVAGHDPSYGRPSLFRIHDDLFALMANHQYGVRVDDADGVSAATMAARAEIHHMVGLLRARGGCWSGLRLVATAGQIGVREGRRIHGRHTVNREELATGARHDDAVCRVNFPVDVHSLDPSHGKGYGAAGAPSQPYDIPLRALISADRDNLLMAGRCISGDFFAHASYRVTGNAVAMGEAAGRCAAESACTGVRPWDRAPLARSDVCCA